MKKLYRSVHIVLVGVLVLSTSLMLPINLVGARPILKEIVPIDQPVIGDETPVEQPIIVPIVGEFTPLPEPTPAVGIMSPFSAVASITMNALVNNGADNYSASGIWDPRAVCWNNGQNPNDVIPGYQFKIKIIDKFNSNAVLTVIDPAPCDNGTWTGEPGDKHAGGIWPGNGQGGNSFALTPGDHRVCAVIVHANDAGNDLATSNCQDVNVACVNPLDYVNNEGVTTPDSQISLSDAVMFTEYYDAKDMKADINGDKIVDEGDLQCANKYIGAGQYVCPIQCDPYTPRTIESEPVFCPPQPCHSPLDYVNDNGQSNPDGKVDTADAVKFTKYYEQHNDKADINKNGHVDYGDYLCAKPYLGNSDNSCRISCAPVCGDRHKDAGEECDDGNNSNHDSCSSSCKHINRDHDTIDIAPAVGTTDSSTGSSDNVKLETIAVDQYVEAVPQITVSETTKYNLDLVVVNPVATEPVIEKATPADDTKVVVKQAKAVVKVEDTVKSVVKPVAVVNTATAVQTPSVVEKIVTVIQSTLNKLMFWR